MSQKHQIENIIKRYIKSNHKTGDRAGGSGHMGHVSFTIDESNFLLDRNFSIIKSS